MNHQRASGAAAVVSGILLFLCLVMNGESSSPAASEEVVFSNAGVPLSGTLYFPERNAPTAAVVLVHGSARPDSLRMTALAQLLAGEGFAVLTYDKRGIGKSGGVFQDGDNTAAFTLMGEDAAAALRVIGSHPRLKRIPAGLIGISQGGWVAPIAASRSPDTAFMVLWSGPVCTVSEEIHFSSFAKKIRNFSLDTSAAEVQEHMRSVPHRPDDFDPRTVLSNLSLPSLWVYGGRDNSIPVELSISRLEGLIKNGHPDFEYRVFPEGGHSLDYPSSVPEAYNSMIAWIRSTATRAVSKPRDTTSRVGVESDRPIEVCRPEGERQYLARLVCPSGEHPEFKRAGNVGPRTPIPANMSEAAQEKLLRDNMAMKPLSVGEIDYHWIDAYEVSCAAHVSTIYMDMYHCSGDTPSHAPPGFQIIR